MKFIDAHRERWKTSKMSKVAVRRRASTNRAKPSDIEVKPNTDAVWKDAARMDFTALKNIPSHADRIEPKKFNLDKYRDYLKDFMTRSDAQNDALYINMIWATDVCDTDWMLELADFAENTGQQPVEPWFKKPPGETVARIVLSENSEKYKSGEELDERFEPVFSRVMNGTWAIDNDKLKAGFYRLEALRRIDNEDFDAALELAKTAEELKPGIGLKGRIEVLSGDNNDKKLELKRKLTQEK